MPKDFSYLRHWITGEKHPNLPPFRPAILECIVSRSGMSLTVYDRGERLYAINGYGFDRLGCALAEFLERCFQPELLGMRSHPGRSATFRKGEAKPISINLEGMTGFSSMVEVAQAIGLKVHQSESKAGTLIIIEKGK